MDIDELKGKLRTYSEEQIIIKEHTLIRCFQRGITRETIVGYITNPEKLVDAIEETAKYPGERKFKLVFEQSRNKNFIIVLTMNRKLNIVTSIIRYRKWVRQVRL
jgi:hypothetical protein